MVGTRALTTFLVAAVACVAVPTEDTKECGLENQYTAQDVVKQLNLTANVEKGYYIQTFEDDLKVLNNRSASTAIYYLLEGSAGQGRWHQVFDVEVWHYYAGAPLTLSLSYNNGSKCESTTLGPDIFHGQMPQVVIASGQFQAAQSLGAWTLVGTTGKFFLLCQPSNSLRSHI